MNLTQAIAKRLKNICKERNITQYKLHKITGVPESTISTIMNSEIKTIKISTLFDICAGLNIEFSDFFDVNFLKIENLDD